MVLEKSEDVAGRLQEVVRGPVEIEVQTLGPHVQLHENICFGL